MRATSKAQYAASAAAQVPDLELVRDGIWALPLALAHGTTPYSFAYFIRDAEARIHVVDTGALSEDNWGAVRFAMTRMGVKRADVASVTVTHMHPDHMGMAARFRTGLRSVLVLHRLEQEDLAATVAGDVQRAEPALLDAWGVPPERRAELVSVLPNRLADAPPPSADVLVDDGDLLDVPGRVIRVVHTPGHTRGSISLVLPEEKLILTGDHVLPEQFPGVGLGAGTGEDPLGDYLASLERVAAFDDFEVLPGHGFRFRGLAERCREIAEHHGHRSAEVAAVLERSPGISTWELASRVTWPAGWANLHGFYLRSALAQTAIHQAFLLAHP